MNPRGLDELFAFLFSDVRRGCVMVLSAYFDESVREQGGSPICVGGYLFKAPRYQRFKERWHREVLRLPNRTQLKHFHMTDLCAGQGVFKGLSIEARQGVLKRAVDVIAACSYAGIGAHFDQDEYEGSVSNPNDWANHRGSIYSQACGLCLQITAHRLRQWRNNAEVLYVFERGHKFQREANEVLDAIAGDARARTEFRYRQHIFEEKDNEYGLQAADLFVWTNTKAAVINGGRIPPAFKPFVGEVIRLSQCLKGRQFVSRFTGDRLRRYLQEQASLENGYIPIAFGNRRPSLR